MPRNDHHRRRDETKDERLLRKAREYVEKEERKKRRKDSRRKNKDDNENVDSGDFDTESDDDSRRQRKQKRKKHREDDRKGRKKDYSDSRTRSRRSKEEDDDSDLDDRDDRKHRRKKTSKRSPDKEKNPDRRSTRRRKKSDRSRGDRSSRSASLSLGPIRGRPPLTLLEPDRDYFAYHQHLWVYLFREGGVAFGDMASSDESRAAFAKFCKLYNRGALEEAYYADTLPAVALQQAQTTKHNWSFQTNDTERVSLQLVEEGVRKQTEYNSKTASTTHASDLSTNKLETREAQAQASSKTTPPAHSNNGRRKTREEKQGERVANRRLREHVRTVHDELTGGKREGRERLLELKKEKSNSIHGAARDREQQQQGIELSDSAIYGGGSSDFQTALARERQRRAARQDQKRARLEELQNKEHQRQQAMLQALGITKLPPGQKITIAPRKEDGQK